MIGKYIYGINGLSLLMASSFKIKYKSVFILYYAISENHSVIYSPIEGEESLLAFSRSNAVRLFTKHIFQSGTSVLFACINLNLNTSGYKQIILKIHEPRHEISNNGVCATSKGSDQPAHTPSLIRAFASRYD